MLEMHDLSLKKNSHLINFTQSDINSIPTVSGKKNSHLINFTQSDINSIPTVSGKKLNDICCKYGLKLNKEITVCSKYKVVLSVSSLKYATKTGYYEERVEPINVYHHFRKLFNKTFKQESNFYMVHRDQNYIENCRAGYMQAYNINTKVEYLDIYDFLHPLLIYGVKIKTSIFDNYPDIATVAHIAIFRCQDVIVIFNTLHIVPVNFDIAVNENNDGFHLIINGCIFNI
jgi:hypothetical protein